MTTANAPFAVFRVDASLAIGSGHLRRCLTLAGALAENGWRCGFAMAAGSAEALPWPADSTHERLLLQGAGEGPDVVARHWPGGCDVLAVDHYGLDDGYESQARPWARYILAIDDLADRAHDCDVLLDQTLGRPAADYAALVPPDCHLLLGPDFALLRPDFAQLRHDRRASAADVTRVLVTLGGSDPRNITLGVIEALGALGPEAPLARIVVGPANPHGEALQQAAAGNGRIAIARGVDDMADLMDQVDLAVAGAGGTAWELAAMGVPAVLIDESPGGVAAALEAAGAAVRLGADEAAVPATLAATIGALMRDRERRQAMTSAGQALVDGAGAGRVAACLTELVKGTEEHRQRVAGP